MLDIDNEYTFQLEIIGEKSKKKYEGKFTVKCLLTNGEEVEVALRHDAYNGGSKTLNNSISLLNRATADLEVRICRDGKGNQLAPSWWRDSNDGRNLFDQNIIYEVFNKALDGLKKYEERMDNESKEAEKEMKKATKRKRTVAEG